MLDKIKQYIHTFKVKATEHTQTDNPTQPKHELPSFAQEYVLVDSKMCLSNYGYFSLCKHIPVAIETKDSTGFYNCIQLPTSAVFMDYLNILYNLPAEELANPLTRTITVFTLDKDKYIYVLPPFKALTGNVVVHFEEDPTAKGWPLYVTPELNKTLVRQLKKYNQKTK
ncbi:MAG: hypothetical protein MJ158_01835 [Alphaproteobacteria bacterium]|nr:hypothetical protein [Alphaproteobacteria bacterium]